jgi:hypothetical protein
MMNTKPRYTATYFVYVNGSCEQRLSSFRGTKRAIINRLKRLNPHSSTDGLQIHDDEDNLLWGESGVLFIGEFFTDDEWFEVSGEEKEVDDCTLNLEKLFSEGDSPLLSADQEEQQPKALGLDPDQNTLNPAVSVPSKRLPRVHDPPTPLSLCLTADF